MSVKGQMSQFAWRCARPEKHDRHRIDGDGYYGPAGYICDGEPPRPTDRCRVFRGSHGCDLPRDHAGWHTHRCRRSVVCREDYPMDRDQIHFMFMRPRPRHRWRQR